MTILVDGRALAQKNPGGVSRVTRAWLTTLAHMSPEDRFLVVTTGIHKPALPSFGPNTRHKHLAIPNKLWSLFCFLSLTSLDRACKKDRPDRLLLPNIGWIGRPKIPYALVVHDLSFFIEPRWFTWKMRLWHKAVGAARLMKHAHRLFAVSGWTKRDLIRYLHIPEEHISLLPLGPTQTTAPAPLPHMLQNIRFILALGADDPRKNSACAIQAIRELKKTPGYEDAVLIVTGKTKKKSTKINEGVLFLDWPTDEALASLYQHALAFLYPSWYEGFGLPLHEAARFGTPCVASTASALPETAPKGTLFAPPGKPHLWTAALKMILDHPENHKTSPKSDDWTKTAAILKSKIFASF